MNRLIRIFSAGIIGALMFRLNVPVWRSSENNVNAALFNIFEVFGWIVVLGICFLSGALIGAIVFTGQKNRVQDISGRVVTILAIVLIGWSILGQSYANYKKSLKQADYGSNISGDPSDLPPSLLPESLRLNCLPNSECK